jgi:hypothetical protein
LLLFLSCDVTDAYAAQTRAGHSTTYVKKTQSIKTVSDEAVEKLGMLFSEQLLLAALDLIDRDCGMRRHLLFLSFLLPPYKKTKPYQSCVIFQQ